MRKRGNKRISVTVVHRDKTEELTVLVKPMLNISGHEIHICGGYEMCVLCSSYVGHGERQRREEVVLHSVHLANNLLKDFLVALHIHHLYLSGHKSHTGQTETCC